LFYSPIFRKFFDQFCLIVADLLFLPFQMAVISSFHSSGNSAGGEAAGGGAAGDARPDAPPENVEVENPVEARQIVLSSLGFRNNQGICFYF
jgi:hypothetical protein